MNWMKAGKDAFDALVSIEDVEEPKPLPEQTLVCIGEYPIKTMLKEPCIRKGIRSAFIGKSSKEIRKWLPKEFVSNFVLGFEDSGIDTHFWYNVLPTISNDDSIIENLKKGSEKLQSTIIFSSIWNGIESATMPTLIDKFKSSNIDPLSIAVMPSKIQPIDAHLNALAAIEMCLAIDGSTVLLMNRDQIENYQGVDRKGELIKGAVSANYLLNLLLDKASLVEEISELSRTFGIKLFAPIMVTGASYRIYGSIENMLNVASLKPFLTFAISGASLLYVLLRMSLNLKDKMPRGTVELAITNWFREKTTLQSIYITEPIYTEDMSDRIDAVLIIGGFDTSKMLSDLAQMVKPLRDKAIEKGFISKDWQVIAEAEQEKIDITKRLKLPKDMVEPKEVEETKIIKDRKIVDNIESSSKLVSQTTRNKIEPRNIMNPELDGKPKSRRRLN